MLDKKFLNMLGLCARSGNCLYGETACLNAIRSGKAEFLLMEHSASDNTRKRFLNACTHHRIPVIEFDPQCGDAAKATGREGYKLIVVTDKSFAKQLFSILRSSKTE